MLVLVLGVWLVSRERGGLNWFRICGQYLSWMSASARFWPRPLRSVATGMHLNRDGVKTRRWECDRPGVEPTSSGCIVWGQYHSSEKVSCDEWYWNPSPHISGYMCGARRVVRGLCCSQQTGLHPTLRSELLTPMWERRKEASTLSIVSSTGRVRRAALHTYIPIYQRWIPVPLITADLFRRVVLSPVMRPRGRGFDARSVTFPPPGFDPVREAQRLRTLGGQSRIRYSLPAPGFNESGIHSASATGEPLGFHWIHVQRFIKWA